jgi:uncharacterized protein
LLKKIALLGAAGAERALHAVGVRGIRVSTELAAFERFWLRHDTEIIIKNNAGHDFSPPGRICAMETDELFDAIRKGDAARVGALLDRDRNLLRAKSGDTSAILMAGYTGHPEIAQLFVQRGATLSFPEACALGDSSAMKLLDRDPSLLNAFSEDGYPPVGLAIFFRHPELARQLIERGADVNAAAKNPQRVAPVHAAIAVHDRDTMRLLLERGADPNARQQEGFTPLHSAAAHGDVEMAKLLMEFGADPNARTDDGKSAIDVAEKYGQPAFAQWMRDL